MTDVLAAGRKLRKEKPYIRLGEPYNLPGPAVYSFSGGRTSGRMLWELLNWHDGKLPTDHVVLFCNTGRERRETLEFVKAVEDNWSVPIHWLEWQEGGAGYREVKYEWACRSGEPFVEMALTDVQRKDATVGRKPLPNPVQRNCTANLKTRVKCRFMKLGLGAKTYHNAVGFRLDEPNRVNRAPASAEAGETIHAPLFDAGVDEAGVLEFWRRQPFDLGLKSYHGCTD